MKRSQLLVLAMLLGALAIGGLVAAFVWLRPRKAPVVEIVVTVRSDGRSALQSDAQIAPYLESELAGVTDLARMRTESTPTGVTVELSFLPPSRSSDEELGRLVLVQSALSKMRCGRRPTDASRGSPMDRGPAIRERRA